MDDWHLLSQLLHLDRRFNMGTTPVLLTHLSRYFIRHIVSIFFVPWISVRIYIPIVLILKLLNNKIVVAVVK